jgi:hypothetical protein
LPRSGSGLFLFITRRLEKEAFELGSVIFSRVIRILVSSSMERNQDAPIYQDASTFPVRSAGFLAVSLQDSCNGCGRRRQCTAWVFNETRSSYNNKNKKLTKIPPFLPWQVGSPARKALLCRHPRSVNACSNSARLETGFRLTSLRRKLTGPILVGEQ